MDDGVPLVEADHGPGRDSLERAAGQEHAVVLGEGPRAHQREGHHAFDTFGRAEALLGEGKIGGNDENDHAVHRGGPLVEFPGRGRADVGVQARDDAEDLLLSGEVPEPHVVQLGTDQAEIRGLAALGRQVSGDVDRAPLQSHFGHGSPRLFSGKISGRRPH
jgi:hypothetical protein